MAAPSKQQIIQAVYDSLGDLAKRLGETKNVTADTDPICDLGLASEDGVEFDCIIEERLGIELPGDANTFIDDETNKPRTVGQIADYLCQMTGAVLEVHRG